MKIEPRPAPSPGRRARSLALPLLILALLAAPAASTWSIVAVDTATGEVVVASATCLAGFDLERGLPVVRVGEGAAAAQSAIDSSGNNRLTIWNGFQQGSSPQQILSLLAAGDPGHQSRQYGIVSLVPNHKPAKFTGSQAGAAKNAVAGIHGSIRYAIQGNVLTGQQVILDAETAFLNAPGDLSQRVMAGMEAARALGGDGRCSCSTFAPTSCGVPPPTFTKSAHVGFIVLARSGDADGFCNAQQGCANGSYYLNLNVIGGAAAQDPVLQLQRLYGAWRAGLAGRPDHVLSTVGAGAQALPADGLSSTGVRVELVDLDGAPLSSGGASLSIVVAGASGVGISPVTDNGDGSYDFTVTAGLQPGTARLELIVDDGQGPVRLYPDLELRIDPPAALHAGYDELSVSAGALVPFVLDLGPAAAGQLYLLLGSASGTAPGFPLGLQTLPLNFDPLFEYTLVAPGAPLLPGSIGLLDANGRAACALDAGPGLLAPLLGAHLDWAALAFTIPEAISNPVGFDLVP